MLIFAKFIFMNINAAFQFLVPKDSKFFPMFILVGENLLEGSKVFKNLTLETDVTKMGTYIERIKEIEHIGDNLTHEIFNELNSTFITPFDRQDIQALTSSMDDVLDYINGTCQRIKAYKPKQIPHELEQMADVLIKLSELILKSIKELKSYKNFDIIKESCLIMNTLENQADDIYYS